MKHNRIDRYAMTNVITVIAVFVLSIQHLLAVDIGPMTWTPKADWINVKNPSAIPALAGYTPAVGDGVTDDTAAIQAILTYVQIHYNYPNLTIYFPAGTYKITSTLTISNVSGVSFIGCGSNTIISWAGPLGGAMYAPNCTDSMRYIGFVWEGNNKAAVAYEEDTQGGYAGGLRHENESFRDINAAATYAYATDANGDTSTTPTPPTAAIVSGYTGNPPSYTGETQVWNCRFYNCTEGIAEAWNIGNFFCWFIDDCEFDNCGTGINLYTGGGNVITSCHFQNSTVADILGGGDTHIRHCTSTGSGYFFSDPGSLPNPTDGNVIEDCWVDSWTNAGYAMYFQRGGPTTLFDCTFTHPPSGASSPISTSSVDIQNHLIVSNNYAAGLAPGIQLVNANGLGLLMDVVPPGLRFGALTIQSASQTFLNTSYPAEGTTVLDISQAPYVSQWTHPTGQDGLPDITAALQSAVNQAISNNNGTIVYIPTGIFNISSAINCTGSNYVIEGNGISSELCWFGADNSSIFSINSPKITVQNLRLAVLDATIAGLTATSSSTANDFFDGLIFDSFQTGNPGATGANFDGPGVVLSNLPAGSTVYAPLLDSTITVQNCGGAQILTKYLAGYGTSTVSGTTPQTGFLGTIFTEGGQQSSGAYDIVVNDNQDLIFGDYYVEQDNNNLSLNRGSGTVSNGRVTIGGFNTASGNTNGGSGSQYLVNVNNYAGRLFYGSAGICNWYNQYPVSVNQTGTNAIDMIFAGTEAVDGYAFTLGSSANLISTLNINSDDVDISETPNPVTATDYLSIAQSLDHFRQLEAVDLSVQNGLATDGPAIAQYPFEGNVLDMTGTYNGTAHGVTYVPGLGAQAASFNGTSSYVQIVNPVDTNFSIAMWINTTDTGGTGQWYAGHGLVDGYNGVNKADFGTALCGGKFAFGVGKTDTTLTSTTVVNDGKWHHLVATRNSTTGAMTIYIDGVLNGTVTGPTGIKSAAANLRIGDLKGGGTGTFYKGAIDLVQIFNYAVSATDVANLYNRSKPLVPLSANWTIVNFDAPGGLGSTNYTGAGADTGGVTPEYWNPIAADGTSEAGLASDGVTLTGVTFIDQTPGAYNFGSPSPIALFNPYLDGSAGANESEKLNNVPAGTYNLYIYSQNGGYADRGGEFTVNGVTQNVSNDGTDHSTFINGVNYTEFTGITLTTPGTISITFQTGSHGEADLNGIQLVKTSP